jgi:hypothetical protein
VTSDAGGNLATNTAAGLGLATTGDIAVINSRLDDLTARSDKAFTGIAMAFAMSSTPQLQANEKVAVASSLGTFSGRQGGALTAAVRLFDHAQLNAGVGIGFSNNIVGGQVGLRFRMVALPGRDAEPRKRWIASPSLAMTKLVIARQCALQKSMAGNMPD